MKRYKDGGYFFSQTVAKLLTSWIRTANALHPRANLLLKQKLKVEPNPGLKGKAIYTCRGLSKLHSR